MSEITDLSFERAKRERPDAEFIKHDDFGREMRLFKLSYEMAGGTWGTMVWAYDMADAESRVQAMRASLVLLGEIHAVVPA